MGQPSISIAYSTTASSVVSRSSRGVVAAILRDGTKSGGAVLTSASQIPTALSAENQAFLSRIWLSAVTKVLIYVMDAIPEDDSSYIVDFTDALAWLAGRDISYLVGPADLAATECEDLAEWVIAQRTDEKRTYKAVLPSYVGDHEAIINFATGGIVVGTTTYSAAQYCSRIAGILAATSLTQSATYVTIAEVSSVDALTSEEQDAAAVAGKFILLWDGRQVKTGRAVNSLTTLTDKSADWQKIKIIEAKDMITYDLFALFEDNWVGRYTNDYNGKLNLLAAVTSYLSGVASSGVIDDSFAAYLNADKQRAYLKDQGTDVDDMTDDDVLKAYTSTHVFMAGTVHFYDAIEDIDLDLSM